MVSMTDITPQAPGPGELPSAHRLLRSTLIAAAVAALLLVAFVLPAEYGVDPTGIGRVLGLKQMGDIKVALAKEAAADAEADAAAAASEGGQPQSNAAPGATAAQPPVVAADTAPGSAPNADTTRITLQPGEGKEVKLVMRRGARATYAWSTEGGGVNYLTHGDTVNAPANSYHTYSRGTEARSHEGTLVAAFDGLHGWFWRNRTPQQVTVTLRTGGDYQEIKEPK
jgi:hypothetical protein